VSGRDDKRADVSDQLRVLVISPFGAMGGQERWLLQLLDATDRLAAEVVLLSDGPLKGELRCRGVPTAVLETGRSPEAIGRAGLRLAQVLRRRRPQVVLANGVKAAAAGAVARRFTRVPVVWMKHDLSFDGWLAAPLGGMVDSVIAISSGVAAALGRPVPVLPPPLPTVDFVVAGEARAHWVERFPSLHQAQVVGMLTRLVPYKGVDDVVTALGYPAARAWHAVVVGDDDPSTPGERDRLRRVAERFGVATRVHFAGAVPSGARLIRGFDAVAVTTRREGSFGGEGFPLAALEALAAGVPLVGTGETPALQTMARAGGLAVPASDPEAIAEALARLQRPEERARAREGARTFVAGHPNARQVADAMVRHLMAAC